MTISRWGAWAVWAPLTLSALGAPEGGVALPAGARVAPAEVREVRGERLRIPVCEPKGWAVGAKLHEPRCLGPGQSQMVAGSVDADSVVIRQGDRTLTPGKDYLIDREWGMLGLPAGSSIGPADEVTVDYRYSLQRLDSIVRAADGQTALRAGRSDLTVPEPPALAPGEARLANVHVPFFSDGSNCEIYPLLESDGQAATLSTRGRIPKTLAKLRAGGPVRVVCWGDSVTVGGDASDRARTRYVKVFEQRLREKFPQADLTVETVAVGGSNSRHWLNPALREQAVKINPTHAECRWERIAEARPDLVTIEFVNDAGLADRAVFDATYREILKRAGELGAELILITPHFTRPAMMGFTSLREAEKRPYVANLRAFAAENGLGLADAAARWEHLWKEGLPYVTLLKNGINHPDDRGHALFADELMKNFED